MGSRVYIVIVFAVLLSSLRIAHARSFNGLGELAGGDFYSSAYGVSDDGSVIVGSSIPTNQEQHAVRWTGGVIQDLGLLHFPGYGTEFSYAMDASLDGAVVVGASYRDSMQYPVRWTAESGLSNLGQLPGTTYCGSSAVSADGSVTVGTCYTAVSSYTSQAFRWTESGGLMSLGYLPNARVLRAVARAVTPDGSKIVGQAVDQAGNQVAFMWTAATGMVQLPFPPQGIWPTDATAVSADGRVVVGFSGPNAGIRWVEGVGVSLIGDLPGGNYYSEPTAMTPDGGIIVGRSKNAFGDRAFIWDETNGIRDIADFLLAEHGLNVGGWTLYSATGISADGRTIAGLGRNPTGGWEAWVARIPEPTCGSLFAIAFIAIQRISKRRDNTDC